MGATLLIVIVALIIAIAGAAFFIRFATLRAQKRKEEEVQRKVQSFLDKGQFQQAALALVNCERPKEAMEILTKHGDFRGAARIALRMHDYRLAAELFERGEDFEGSANALLRIPDFRRAAVMFSRAKDHEQAAKLFVQIGDMWAAAEEMVAMGQLKEASAIHRQLGNDLVAEKLLGSFYKSQGDMIQAAQCFSSAGEHLYAGECYQSANRFVEAARAFQKAHRPELAATCFEKAQCYSEAAAMFEEAGEHAKAAKIYQLIKDPSGEIKALVGMGDFLTAGHLAYKLGRKEEAEEILKMATPADRGYARSCLLLGRILEETGRKSEALKYYGLFVERAEATEKNKNVFALFANMFEKERLYDLALKALRKMDLQGLLDPQGKTALSRLQAKMEQIVTSSEMPAVSAEDLLVPPQLLKRYETVRKLGEGGTSIVYLVNDKVLKRNVVLKILSNPTLPTHVAQDYFLREAQIVASLVHPNILTVYDAGHAGGRMYMVMEYLDGQTLDAMIEERKALPLKEVANIALQLGEALAYAHEKNIVHRDIKPGNVMVMKDGLVKLMDFGMAKALDIHTDKSLYICGTPDYMSPEQESGEELAPSSDIYSLGLTLMEAILGGLPSARGAVSAREKRLKALEQAVIPEAVKAVIRKCLELEPTKRPQSARMVVRSLAKAVEEAQN
jgi:tRNA A-37 threonylcarbamoyl transferase component Bud32